MVRRVFVEKRPGLSPEAAGLLADLRDFLGIHTLLGVRVLRRYDVENLEDDAFEKAKGTVFSEPQVDVLYEEDFPRQESDLVFSVEYLPGQFDQRADSAEQCVKLLKEDEEPVIRSAVTYVISGQLDEGQFNAVKNFCINPVDSREAGADKPKTLIAEFKAPADVAILKGF